MSEPSNTTDRPDRLGLRSALDQALRQPELASLEPGQPASPAADAAAYRLARALGECALFGVDPDELGGTLPVVCARAAVRQAQALAERVTEQARTLGELFDQTRSGVEAEQLVAGLLLVRTDLQAAFLALEEADLAALEQGHPDHAALDAELDGLVAALEELDAALQDQLELLTVAADTNLLRNLRAQLAEPYRSAPFWWLDGTIEAVAERSYEQVLETAPSPEAWARLRGDAPGSATLPFPAWLSPIEGGLAAASEPAEAPPSPRYWRSPDGRFLARLIQPAVFPSADAAVMLSFHHARADRAAAPELAGQPVWFLGVPGQLDDRGRATFGRGRLGASEAAGDELSVGPDRLPWAAFDPYAADAGSPESEP
jgi:hypothetical protein